METQLPDVNLDDVAVALGMEDTPLGVRKRLSFRPEPWLHLRKPNRGADAG